MTSKTIRRLQRRCQRHSWSFNQVVDELNRVLEAPISRPTTSPNPYSFTQDWTETDGTAAMDGIGYRSAFDLRKGIEAYAASGQLGVSR